LTADTCGAEEDAIIERLDEERRARLLALVQELLNPKDYEVWRLVEEGHTNQEIAENLGLQSEGTVRYRKKRIERTLGPALGVGEG
jgi:DNA-binding NarL/FixJ family response regulator